MSVKEMIKHILFRDNDADVMWKLREKILNGKSTLFDEIRYRRLVSSNDSFIPIDCVIVSQPVFPHGIKGIFISQGAVIGRNCTIFHQVTIGSNNLRDSKHPGSPTLGNNVYVGCGAKIIGNIHIGDNVRIGANCVITQDVEQNSTVVLVPPVLSSTLIVEIILLCLIQKNVNKIK